VAKLADVEFVAKSPGLKLAGNSYGLQKGLSGFGSLNNLQTGDIRQPKISLSLQNSFAVFVTEQELVSWAKDNTEIECEVLIVIPSDGLDSGGTESAVIKINQNLLAARDSIKKLEVSDKVANQERSGLKLPSAITSRFEGVTEALKSLTTKMPKSEKPERARKSEKNKQSEDKASQGQTDDSYDPFNQPG
jgi:hypothetical protein